MEQTRLRYKATQDLGRPIGHVEWEISEVESGQSLEQGTKEIALGDVTITEIIGGPQDNVNLMWAKSIPLEGPFEFALSHALAEQMRSGFALKGERTDVEYPFSWEWFVIDGPDHASKLQESGELSFSTSATPSGMDIVYTEFLTDVSLRITTLHEPLGTTLWRIKILAGSKITWPVLQDHVVAPHTTTNRDEP